MQAFQWEQKDDSTPLWVHMIAGSCAGLTEHISMLPLDNIKTHCQAGSTFRMMEIVKNIYQTGGLQNFYSGSSVLAMGCVPAHAIYFSIYQQAKRILGCSQEQNGYRFALVGALSSLFHDLIMTPTQVVKQRLQIYRTQTKWINTRGIIKQMYQTQGIKAFYRSFAINYSMNIPFSSMIVLMNEKLKVLFKVEEGGFNNPNGKHWKYYMCGGIAGALAAIPTTPFDVIKTKLNTQACLNHPCEKRSVCQSICKKTQKFSKPMSSANANLTSQSMQMLFTSKISQIKYKNVFQTTRIVMNEQGVMGFFAGLRMRMIIQSVSSAIAWGTYQVVKSLLHGDQAKAH